MLKRSILLVTSIAVLLALAPAAQATGPLITNSFGAAAKTITGSSTNTVTIVPPIGAWECLTNTLHVDLTTNASTTAEGSGTGSMNGTVSSQNHNSEHCGVSSGGQVYIDLVLNRLHLAKHDGVTTGTADLVYTYMTSGLFGDCIFEGAGATVMRTGPSTIGVSASLKRIAPSGPFCPETGVLAGDFTFRDESDEPVTIH